MGSASEGSEGGIVGDCTVGTIVWVRRRNGSWWPGRVLGVDELAESQLMSPRSGTPVKLLGREDASVDWYNLEKSKRVKPFRCGEFDACIGKAEASFNTPFKKREKYARREDAILHALELERHQLEIQQESTSISSHACNNTLSISKRESNHYTSEAHVQSKLANQKSQSSSRKITTLLDEYYLDHPFRVHKNRKVKTSICKDDKQEIATHMRVETVGRRVFKSKGKRFHYIAGRNSDITVENNSDLLPQSGHNSAIITQAASGKNISLLKRKSHLTGAINDTPAKRRDRRRPLLKVLQNSTKLQVSKSLQPHHDISSNTIPGEKDHMGITNDSQKDTTMHSSPDAVDPLDYSRNPWKQPPVDDWNAYHVQQSGCVSNESIPSGWTEENEFDSSATDSELEIVEEKLRSGITQPFKLTAESPVGNGMSKWHLKGKRNNRTTLKKLHESVDEKNLGCTDKSIVQLREASPGKFEPAMLNDDFGQQLSSEKEIDYDTEDDQLFTGLENKRVDLLRLHSDSIDSDDDQQLVSHSGWGPVGPSFQMWRAYWGEPEDNFAQFYGFPFSQRMMPMLVDVDLKVQARYQGERVPLVSLLSKLNGKAIIGHPVPIEVLEDGSTDLLYPLNEPGGDTASLQICKTGKRTSMPRILHPNPDPQKSSYLESLATRVKKKGMYHSHRSASGRFQRKPLKTVSLSSSKKTKALSSLVSEKKLDSGNIFLSGLINPDGSIPPTTCIPTKVVFSRILESLGRPSSVVAPRAVAGISAENDPS